MSAEEYQPSKIFTVASANQTLPLVRVICQDMVELAKELMDRRERLSQIRSGRKSKSGELDPYSDEIAQMVAGLDEEVHRLQAYAHELRDLGVEPKSASEGLVDFPAIRGGRLVFLCWKLGEERVKYWHDLEAGFAGRQPLETGTEDAAPQNTAASVSEEEFRLK
jgi:hypothetical protein